MPIRRAISSLVPLALVLAMSAASAAEPEGAAGTPYLPAEDCATCHEQIHRFWSESPHATSASSPAYLEALRRTIESSKDEKAARRACVWCHAPTTLVTRDLELKLPISKEGVTCDFCHTVKDVDMEKIDHPFVLKPGDVKRGPFEYTQTDGHESAYSPLHKFSPLICAACHEHTNANGVAVLSTYSEWKEGPYPARGVPCQDCHMAPVPGAVTKDQPPSDRLRLVNLHRVVGGSARSQLNRGLDLKIDSLVRQGGTATVRVVVTNEAAGHPVPGGLSTKTLVLAVGIETADESFTRRQERTYLRELKDDRGRVVKTVADLFIRAASVGRDNRIKPGESRTERFSVPIPQGGRAVVVRLEYRDSSDPRVEPQTALITEIRRPLSAR